MNHNNGKSQNIDGIKNYEKAIEDFSEGNLYLEKLLLECYKLGIKTVACCAGHAEEFSLPYIAFAYSENKNVLYYIVSKLKDTNIEFRYIGPNSFSLEFDNYNEDCFKILTDILIDFDNSKDYFNELPNDLKIYFEIINKIEQSNIFESLKDSVSKNYFQFSINKTDDVYSYNLVTNDRNIIGSAFNSGFYIRGEEENRYLSMESENRKYFDKHLLKMLEQLNQYLTSLNIDKDSKSI